MDAQINFFGAAGTVTGSCYRLKVGDCQFLVDCGMFQGGKTLKALNYEPFPFKAEDIDFVLLTHAHIDHSGMLPKLVKHGFKGHIFTTEATRDLLTYMLPDSGYIQEMEVEHLNRRNRQRGKKTVEPVYTRAEAEACLPQIRPIEYETWLELGNVRARFWNAGHILGAASIEVDIAGAGKGGKPLRMLFSGDIGPDNKLFYPDPEGPSNLDYVLCESTYGGRYRGDVSPEARRRMLGEEVNDALKEGGSLVIPSFAVERSQELLLDLAYLLHHKQIPNVPVFLDSPLAIRITSVFAEHADELEDMEGMGKAFSHPNFHLTETVAESKSIARFTGGAIILAASGMCDAGRIRHHLKNHLWRPQSTVLLVGYQAEGTLGRLLEHGVKAVKIQGEMVQVRARIRTLDVYSGHADGDGLIAWVKERLPVRKAIFLIHGSKESLKALRDGLLNQGLPARKLIVPRLDDEFDLTAPAGHLKRADKPRRIDPKRVDVPDWHNDLAQLTLDIREALDKVATEKQRGVILRRLHRALKGGDARH